jgi:hypothetical protein
MLACVLAVGTTAATAQQEEPIGPFAVDVRGALARYGENPGLARPLGLSADALPTGGLGLDLSGTWYPLPRPSFTLGIGFGAVGVQGKEGPVENDLTPRVRVRLVAAAPHASVNFGSGKGWSYLSGGIGLASLRVEVPESQQAAFPARQRMFHYGGGARWFSREHVAFSFDVRFYTLAAAPATETGLPVPRIRMMIISVGASFK